MGYLNVFQGGDVVDTEGENFHLNIQSLPKKVKVEKLPGQGGATQICLSSQRP